MAELELAIHAPRDFCDVMIQGNIALNNGEFAKAIDHYTEILYKLSPGHVCALLNRSMAFIHTGHGELAVVDAYRAHIAAYELEQVCLEAGKLFIPLVSLHYETVFNPRSHLEC